MNNNYQKDMYRQMEELFAKVEALESTVKKQATVIKQTKAENESLLGAVRTLTGRLEKRETELSEARDVMDQLANRLERLEKENALLKEENTRLKSDRDNNSGNSSNPPSSDRTGGKKANSYNARKKSGKKHGAQPGHKGTTLSAETAKELIAQGNCKHEICVCGDSSTGSFSTKYEIDIDIETKIIEYRIYEGADRKGLPRGSVFYGEKLKALAAELYGVGVVSVQRIQDIIHSITNGIISISAGAIYGFCRKLSDLARPTLEKIETTILDGNVAYTDATVVTIDGRQAYIRNVSNSKAVRYYAMEHKNLEEMKKLTLLSKFAGIFVHDHETSMYHFGTGHGECNVHILRYLLKNTEDSANTWSGKLSALLYEMKEARDKAVENAKGQSLPEQEIEQFIHRYDEILKLGLSENQSTRPKWAKKEELALLNRLTKYKDNHLLFIRQFEVAFSNNMSERDLRKCKNRQKVAGGFRSYEGCKMYADILSVIETAKRLDLNVFDTILAIFHGQQPLNASLG